MGVFEDEAATLEAARFVIGVVREFLDEAEHRLLNEE